MRSSGPNCCKTTFDIFKLGGGEDISRLSLCRGVACGFVWHQQGPSCSWHPCGEQETLHQRSLCHVAAVGVGNWKTVARCSLPPLNGCHGVWLHSGCSMMDYDESVLFFACSNKSRQIIHNWDMSDQVRCGKFWSTTHHWREQIQSPFTWNLVCIISVCAFKSWDKCSQLLKIMAHMGGDLVPSSDGKRNM